MKAKTAQRLGLVFDFNAFSELDQIGLNVLDKKKLDKLELTPNVVRQLVWAGLLHKNSALTLEEAGKKFNMTDLGWVTTEIQASLTKAFTGK